MQFPITLKKKTSIYTMYRRVHANNLIERSTDGLLWEPNDNANNGISLLSAEKYVGMLLRIGWSLSKG
jgi:hypothetical protein